MKLSYKIFLLFLLGSLLLLTLSIGLFYFVSSKNLRHSIEKQLETAANLKTSQVTQLLDKLVVRTIDFSSDGAIRDALVELQTATSTVGTVKENIRDHLIENKLPVDGSLITVFLVDVAGEPLVNSYQGGNNNAYFPEGIITDIQRPHVFSLEYSDSLSQPILAVYAPIYSNGVYYGGVVNVFDATVLYGFLTDHRNFQQTWESYLVRSDYYMVSPSRYVEGAEFTQKVETDNAINCFSRKTNAGIYPERTILEPFRDYRGVMVVGTSIFIPNINMCLLAEIDYSEVNSPLERLWQIGIILLLVVIGISLGISWIFSQLLLHSLQRLQKGIEIVESGNFDYAVGTNSNDEIGKLSRAFDKMIYAIKQSRSHIDAQVQKQTKQVEENKKDLERALKETEFLNKTMIGRELKMIELKKKIKKQKEIIEELTQDNQGS